MILNGVELAQQIKSDLRSRVSKFVNASGVRPCLAVVLTTNDPASRLYVKKKQEACQEVGIRSILFEPLRDQDEDYPLLEINNRLALLNDDPKVNGILVQLPLPESVDRRMVFRAIHPHKDVDVLHPENVGLLMQGQPRYLTCTPHGVMQMLWRSGIEILGKRAVVINASDIVGKPLAMMLTQEGATVTICHDKTPPDTLKEISRSSDIVVVAVGKPGFLTVDMVKPGATVIDVGITRINNRVVGDVDFEAVKEVAGAISPVPGGVGPLTVSMLLYNTLQATEMQLAG